MRAVGLAKENSCEFPLTQSVMGDALGLSTVHVNRSLMDLRGRGLIALDKHMLTVLEWAALQDEAGFRSSLPSPRPCTRAGVSRPP